MRTREFGSLAAQVDSSATDFIFLNGDIVSAGNYVLDTLVRYSIEPLGRRKYLRPHVCPFRQTGIRAQFRCEAALTLLRRNDYGAFGALVAGLHGRGPVHDGDALYSAELHGGQIICHLVVDNERGILVIVEIGDLGL